MNIYKKSFVLYAFLFSLIVKGMEQKGNSENNDHIIKNIGNTELLSNFLVQYKEMITFNFRHTSIMFHKKNCVICSQEKNNSEPDHQKKILKFENHDIAYKYTLFDKKNDIEEAAYDYLSECIWNMLDECSVEQIPELLLPEKYDIISCIDFYFTKSKDFKIVNFITKLTERKSGKKFGTLLFLELCCKYFNNFEQNKKIILFALSDSISFYKQFNMHYINNPLLHNMFMEKQDLINYFNSKEKIIIDTPHAQNIREFLKCNEIDFEDRYWNDINQKIRNSKFFNFFKHLFIKN